MAERTQSLWRAGLWIVATLAAAFAGIQFIRPALPNAPVTAELQAPPEVKQILATSCYNCHSNQTVLSWFDQLVPAYWLVVRDVREGRKHLNFSEIGKLPAAQQRAILFEAVSQIELGAMPLPAYKRVHPESAITREQLAVLKNYLTPPAQPAATAAEIAVADAQYNQWIQSGSVSGSVAGSVTPAVSPAPNGIAFLPEYKDWKAISSTERFDNRTMRVILGNDIAVQAIANNHINPWPDGTAFAKVAWFQLPDENGLVRTGPFFQVEFMIKDSQKYAGTKGWGWARWRGADLKPYGKDATFTSECVGCHSPLASTNYVFTSPIRGQQ
jgi:Haem-binding domain/Cytochrome P460